MSYSAAPESPKPMGKAGVVVFSAAWLHHNTNKYTVCTCDFPPREPLPVHVVCEAGQVQPWPWLLQFLLLSSSPDEDKTVNFDWYTAVLKSLKLTYANYYRSNLNPDTFFLYHYL